MQFNIFKHKTIASIHVLTMLVMFIFVLLFASIMIYNEYDTFDRHAKKIHEEYIETQKKIIVFDTKRVLKFIEYMYQKYHKVKSTEELQREVLNAVEHLYERQDGTGYIFIYGFDGTVLSDPVQSHNVGKNLYNMEDSHGVQVIKDLIDVSQHAEGGFVEYQWLKPTTQQESPKISYATSFKPWEWMLGTGVYLDEIEQSILEKRKALKSKLNAYLLNVLLMLIVLFAVGFMGIMIANKILKKEIQSFTNFFKTASSSHVYIDKKDIALAEFKKMVTYINIMIDEIGAKENKLKKLNETLELKVEEKTKDLSKKNHLLEEEKSFSEKLVRSQDNFIKHSIHEINTPLAVILTNIDIYKLKFEENKYIGKIEAGAKMIANIYDDLSYMVKKDHFVYEKELLSFSDFLRSRIDFFEEIAKGNRHPIEAEIEDDAALYFSKIELQRIVDNNLSNAIKYAHQESAILVKLYKENAALILEFWSASEIKDPTRIFEPFHREETLQENLEDGFGLGLEIVYSICKKEEVEIEVDSKESRTLFRYCFKKGVLDNEDITA